MPFATDPPKLQLLHCRHMHLPNEISSFLKVPEEGCNMVQPPSHYILLPVYNSVLNELTGTATNWMDHIKAPEWLPAIRCTSRMLQWQNLRPTCANAVVPIHPIVVYCGLWKGICTMISWWYSLGMTLVATNLESRYFATRWGPEYTWTVSNCLEQSFWESFNSRVETLYVLYKIFTCILMCNDFSLSARCTQPQTCRLSYWKSEGPVSARPVSPQPLSVW